MSMLAERRQKQKWSLNPRGKWWTEDSNKFGQKMLEKMGWTKGKGLGINEQGITEYLNVPYKKDTAGIGYNKNVDIWMEHQEKFTYFLQQLHGNENQNTEIQKLEREDNSLSGQSLELKSKQSRARVHYKKFTHGKDINKYKPKDLANIFGQKELNSNEIQIKIEEDDNVYEQKDISKDKVFIINSGSMTDYFKHKPNYDKNFSRNMIDNPASNSESENEQYVGFGYVTKTENTLSTEVSKDFDEKSSYAFDNPCLGLNSPTKIMLSNIDSTCKKSAKRKKEYESDNLHAIELNKHNIRKKLKTEIINENCKDGFTNPALNLDIKLEEDCNGKEFEVSRAQFGLENCGLDLTDERNGKKGVTFDDHITLYEYGIDSTKKKKGKATLDKFEVENKKHKKKRKQESIVNPVSNGFVNEALDIETISEEINENKLNEHKTKKKRKICKISSLETIQESPEQEKEIIEINVESENMLDTNVVKNRETDIVDKKLKKKKKEKKIKVKNIIVVDIVSEVLDIGSEEITRDKQIKKHKESKEEIEISKKHKKEKKKDKENFEIKKCAIQTEISSDHQNIEMLDKTNSKQQQNYLIMDKNKDATEIEILSVVRKEKEEKIFLNKQKKKKKKSIHQEDCFRNECDVKKEISDKENVGKEEDSNTKKLEKKGKKCKKSKENNVFDTEDSINSNLEIVDENTTKQEEVENIESTSTSLMKSRIIDSIDNIIHSPWSAKKMSKKMLINLFQNNQLLNFPGSNIHDIKGYGVDITSDTN